MMFDVSVISQICGHVGVLLVLAAFFMLQSGWLSYDRLAYSLMNFVGSILLLFSLVYAWNLPSVLIEIAWMSISAYGMVRVLARVK
jgi:hypothetical protein